MFHWPIDLSIDIANCVVLLFTALALIITFHQIKIQRISAADDASRERHISRMASAQESFRSFIRLSFENPELALAIYDKNNAVDQYRYDTLVAIMLYSFEEIMFVDHSPEWKIAFLHHIRPHRAHIIDLFGDKEDKYQCRKMYSRDLIRFIDEFIDKSETPTASGKELGSREL